VMRSGQRSFDCASALLRKTDAPLRMTEDKV
jgi:hypothetical protein